MSDDRSGPWSWEGAPEREDILTRLQREGREEAARIDPIVAGRPDRAEPASVETQEDRRAGVCEHCGRLITLVPGGRGPHWVHIDGHTVCKRR